ncbi:type II toxin-antitoxin system RelE/ParE family toxin [Azospirillum sp. ST 5-10]|uniref:type II toxin-antitoxin system RelE/ParE family toxin n=1 Tax=unclassified Azospirillum TaxID=2630922 RepID=UPI003F4A1473
MRVVFTSAAEADIAAALDWYDRRAPGIGPRFLDELANVTRRIAANPHQFPTVGGETRRAAFRTFPYGIFFEIRRSNVVVFACLHASRDPERWRRRI